MVKCFEVLRLIRYILRVWGWTIDYLVIFLKRFRRNVGKCHACYCFSLRLH